MSKDNEPSRGHGGSYVIGSDGQRKLVERTQVLTPAPLAEAAAAADKPAADAVAASDTKTTTTDKPAAKSGKGE